MGENNIRTKYLFIINGKPRAGKDTFVEFVSKYIPTKNYSSIDKVKEIAIQCGWNGRKSERDRKFLSDLKKLLEAYNDLPFNYCLCEFKEFLYSDDTLMFLHIREPENINIMLAAVTDFNSDFYRNIDIKDRIIVYTLFVNRDGCSVTSNSSDANVTNYDYDFYIDNDGDIQDLDRIASEFASRINNGEI